MRIRELLARDLDQKIEEVIQVDQAEEASVLTELAEYVVTDRIREHYQTLLTAIAEAPSNPDEGVGVWISGFFGSGKSSFAKNLGYVLANREVCGRRAADLFKERVGPGRVSDLVDSINARIPTEVVMFDVQKDRSQSGQGNLSISPFIYRVLLRELDYAEDFDIAGLEISLEGEGRLEDFIARFNAHYAAGNPKDGWTLRGRSQSEVWNRAGRVLHDMDPATYPAPESFAHGLAQNHVELTPRLLVERAFELAERRRPGKALTFIVDEVGAYVSYSQERLEDLRAVVELFGRESKNRIKARKAKAPIWVIVTAQEKLDEVTSAMGDDRRVLLAKVRDRFAFEIDLSPADIREVATKRVLSKTDSGHRALEALFADNQGILNAACTLERTTRKSALTSEDFAQFYPYLPHYVELSIDIVSGIRLQPGAMRHVGGSNRTIIGQIYQMLVNPRTAFADRPVGALVSLDRVFDLIEGQIGSAEQKDIADIGERFHATAADQGWSMRVAKAICLLEFVRDLPRTPRNIAAVLVETVGKPAPEQEVGAALERLEEAQFVRNTEEGYKLQTAQEKSWTGEREKFLDLKPRERNEIKRELLGGIFTDDPNLKSYKYAAIHTFRVGITVDGMKIGDDGQVPLAILTADDAEALPARVAGATEESRAPTHRNDIYWVFALTAELDGLVASLFASRQMIAKYDTMRSRGQITNEEASSLGNEKGEEGRIKGRLRERLIAALTDGTGIFRGVPHDASSLGKGLVEVIRSLFDIAVPDLYPKLEMGARPLKGSEAEEVLKAANLNGLSSVFYVSDTGLGLVLQEGQKWVPNPNAPIAREVLEYLRREQAYGNKVTGKLLEDHFGGIGYGWGRDVLLLVLAVLLRAGAIEVTHQGRRFRNHLDPQCRIPLTNVVQFRSAAFAPRESIDLKTLIAAVKNYEELTGDEMDMEEGAIAAAFKALAGGEMNDLLPVIATVRANKLPVEETLEDYRQTLLSAQNAASDDCVRILAGEGTSFKELRDQVRRIRDAVSDKNLALVREARAAMDDIGPVFKDPAAEAPADAVSASDDLSTALGSSAFLDQLPAIDRLNRRVRDAYRGLYRAKHEARYEEFSRAVEEVKGRPEWALLIDRSKHEGSSSDDLDQSLLDSVLSRLSTRHCVGPGTPKSGEAIPAPEYLPDDSVTCIYCHATLSQMRSDSAALPALKAAVIAYLVQSTSAPEQRVISVRAADYFGSALTTAEAVNQAMARLGEALKKHIAEGTTVIVE